MIARTALLCALLLSACGAEELSAPPPVPVHDRPARVVAGPTGLALETEALDKGLRVGVNLPPIFSYARTPMFVDLMRRARRFGTARTPWDERAVLDEEGWPIGDFGIMLLSAQRGDSFLPGRYTIAFQGQAQVEVVASAAVLGTPVTDTATGETRIALEVSADSDQLALAFTGTGGSVRALRVLRPGYDTTDTPLFTREFLNHLAPYPVLRTMDWTRTNNHPVSRWSQRATDARHHTATDKGVPWEVITELARITGKDLWINIPALADDDYVRQLARLLNTQLPATTTLYVEYSNEVWNAQFRQFAQNMAAAREDVRLAPELRLDVDNSDKPDQWGYRRIAARAKTISDIFRDEFGDAAMMTRIRPIYATQVVNPYITRLGLDYIDAVFGPPARYFYAVAGAPYFNLGAAQETERLDTDAVLDHFSQSIEALPRINRLEENVALALWYGLPFLAYEGGADSFGPGSIDAKKAASLDPRMEGLCRRYLDVWFGHGGGLFMWFTAGAGNWDTRYGTWELTTDLAMTDTPKTRCLAQAQHQAAPAARARHVIPGRIDARDRVGIRAPYSASDLDTLRHLKPGAHVDYLVHAPAAGRYALTLNAAAQDEGNRIEVLTDEQQHQGTVTLPGAGWDRPVDAPPLIITLRAGLNVIRLAPVATRSGFDLRAVTLRALPPDS